MNTASDAIVLLGILVSLPGLIGLMSQRTKGRSGAAWWFLSLVMLFFFCLSFAAFIDDRGEKPLVIALSGAILFGVMPLIVIVCTRPRRMIVRQFGAAAKLVDASNSRRPPTFPVS
jgi:hypothetical protein